MFYCLLDCICVVLSLWNAFLLLYFLFGNAFLLLYCLCICFQLQLGKWRVNVLFLVHGLRCCCNCCCCCCCCCLPRCFCSSSSSSSSSVSSSSSFFYASGEEVYIIRLISRTKFAVLRRPSAGLGSFSLRRGYPVLSAAVGGIRAAPCDVCLQDHDK